MDKYKNELMEIFEKAKKYDKLVQLKKEINLHCSFCGNDDEHFEKLVAAGTPGVYICDQCVKLACEIIDIKTKEEK